MRVLCNKSEDYVTKGKEYIVFSMEIWNSKLLILLVDDGNSPSWYNIELFSVSDQSLPYNWNFLPNPRGEQLQAIWGYKTILENSLDVVGHHNALLERDPEALKIFEEERIRQENIEVARAEFAENPQKREEYLLINYGITLDELKDIVAKVGL